MPNISYFHAFGCKCFVHNNGKETLRKFDAKSNECIFLGYSSISKAYRVFNKRIEKVEESIHVIFYETNRFVPSVDDDDASPDIEDKMICISTTKRLNHLNKYKKNPRMKISDLPKE